MSPSEATDVVNSLKAYNAAGQPGSDVTNTTFGISLLRNFTADKVPVNNKTYSVVIAQTPKVCCCCQAKQAAGGSYAVATSLQQ